MRAGWGLGGVGWGARWPCGPQEPREHGQGRLSQFFGGQKQPIYQEPHHSSTQGLRPRHQRGVGPHLFTLMYMQYSTSLYTDVGICIYIYIYIYIYVHIIYIPSGLRLDRRGQQADLRVDFCKHAALQCFLCMHQMGGKILQVDDVFVHTDFKNT